jgi:hypothetical protein
MRMRKEKYWDAWGILKIADDAEAKRYHWILELPAMRGVSCVKKDKKKEKILGGQR